MTKSEPPVARKEPRKIAQFSDTRTDPYRWLRDLDFNLENPALLNPDIEAHLKAENAYLQDQAQELSSLTRVITEEMKGRIILNESSVPHRDGAWEYWQE